MKLTKGALTMLLAQYRAIYKNAFIKGLATAALATAVLASSSANAAPAEAKADGITAETGVTNKANASFEATNSQDFIKLFPSITVENGHTLEFKKVSSSSGSFVIEDVKTLNAFGSLKFSTDTAFKNITINSVAPENQKDNVDYDLTIVKDETLSFSATANNTTFADLTGFAKLNGEGTLKIEGEKDANVEVKVTEAQLTDKTNGFLTSTTKGKITLSSGGVLNINATDATKGLTLNDSLFGTNSGNISGDGIIKSDKVNVDTKITNANTISVDTNDLTVGTDKTTSIDTGLKVATVHKKLTIQGNEKNGVSVKDSFILDGDFNNTNIVTSNQNTIKLDTTSKGLTVQKGKWTIDKNLEVASGSLVIGDTKANQDKSATAELSLSQGAKLTLNANSSVTLQNAILDLSSKDAVNTVDTSATLTVKAGGRLDIDNANLTGDKKLATGKIALESGAILNVKDDLILDDAKLVSGGSAGINVASDATLQGTKITLNAVNSKDVELKNLDVKSKLDFDSFTFMNKGTDNKTSLTKGIFVAHNEINVLKDKDNGILALEGANASDVTLNLKGTGTINAKELQLKQGTVNVDGAWSVAGQLSTNTQAQKINMEANSSLSVDKLAITSGAGLTVNGGNLIVVGTDKNLDIDLKDNVTIGEGSILTIGKLAVDDVLTKTLDIDNNVKINLNRDFATDKLQAASSTSTLKLDLNNTYVFTKESLKDIQEGLKTFTGFINFGDAKFDDTFVANQDGRYSYDEVKYYSESKFTNNQLEKAVIETKSSDKLMGSFGSLYVTDNKEQNINAVILNKTDKGNHFISNKDGTVGSAKVTSGGELVLKNGGEISNVTLQDKASLIVVGGNSNTVLGNITSDGRVTDTKLEFSTGSVKTNTIDVKSTKFNSVTNADINSLKTTSLDVTNSSVKVLEKVELTNSEVANISNSKVTVKDFNLNGSVQIGQLDKNGVLQVADLVLSKGSTLTIDGKLTSTNSDIAIGYAQNSDNKDAQIDNTYANMFVKDAKAFKGTITIESGLNDKSSLAVFAAEPVKIRATPVGTQLTLNFKSEVGENGIVAYGFDTLAAANKTLVDNGLLSSVNGTLGKSLDAIALVNTKLVLGATSDINLNSTGKSEAVQLGKNTAIVLTNDAFAKDKTAIQLDTSNTQVYFDKVVDGDKEQEAKILLAGKFTVNDVKDLTVFGTTTGTVTGATGLQVETVNGLLNGTIGTDGKIADYKLADNYRSKLYQASNPIAKYIGNYADGTIKSTVNDKSNTKLQEKRDFFDTLVTTSSGLDIEQAARYAVYGGTVKVAELASKAGSEAILAYAQGANTVATAQTSTGSIFVVPTYKSSESDSFDAEGVEYGTDIKLSGVSLGADYAINPNFKLGAMFNIGTGDADGKSIASGIESDIDYVGGGLFATFENGALKVVSDITYTDISSDVKSSIGINNYSADSNANVLSLGVNGEYKFDLDGSYVTPHAGVRYSKYDIDNVTVKANGKSYFKTSYDDMSVISLPVGVTLGTDMETSEWLLQPSLDLGVVFNLGDTDLSHSAQSVVLSKDVALTSEILDDVVFAIKGSLKASYSNVSLGLGLGYEVGSNADDLSVQATGVYTF